MRWEVKSPDALLPAQLLPGMRVVVKTVGGVDLLASGEYCEKSKSNRMHATLQFYPDLEHVRIG